MSVHSTQWCIWLVCAFAALSVSFYSLPASGTDHRWIDAAGGWFDTDTNWDPVGEPGATDRAIFDISGTYTVLFYLNHTNQYLRHNLGYVTFGLNTHTYTITSSTHLGYDVGDWGRVTVLDGNVSSSYVYLGYSSTANGRLTVSSDGTWSSSEYFYIGYSDEASGNLIIEENGSVTADFIYIGCYNDSEGTVSLMDTASQLSSAGTMMVGYQAQGTLNVYNGSSVFSNGGYIGYGVDEEATQVAYGHVYLTGADSSWTNTGQLTVGFRDSGSGGMDILSGASVSNTDCYIGDQSGAVGQVNVSGSNSRWTTTDLTIGNHGNGQLQIDGGGAVASTYASIGYGLRSEGDVSVTGSESQWNLSSNIQIANQGSARLEIASGGHVRNAYGSIAYTKESSGIVEVKGSGSLWTNSEGLTIGNSGSAELDITNGGTVQVTNTLQIWDAGTVNLSGGTIETGALVMAGSAFNFTAGTLRITNSDLFIHPDGPLGEILNLRIGMNVDVIQDTYVDPVSLLVLGDDASLHTNMLVNSGEIQLQGTTALVGGSTLVNHGLLTGNGRIQSALGNQLAGEIRGASGQRLVFTASGNSNFGEINLSGGSIEFTEDLTNMADGFISGRGELRVDGDLTNHGVLALSGGFTDIYGDVIGHGGSKIVISGGSTTTFYDDVHSDGSIQISANSSAIFFGAFSGSGIITGPGTAYIEGDLRPGNSPAEVSFGGNVYFGPLANLVIELGGTIAGNEYDKVTVDGLLHLDGALTIALFDDGSGPFSPQAGDIFDILDWGTLDGQFSEISLPGIADGLLWNTDALYATGEIGVVAESLFEADFDEDGDVDSHDLNTWQTGFGKVSSAQHEDGDADADGDVDGSDFFIWQQQFGSLSNRGTTYVAGIPEPGTFVLAFLLALLMCAYRQRR
ncbi:MAG: hypothetical protein JW829_08460 [Pirellulales bacterium]|nr:hypothetical protein [Pirellulales bacterium]